MNYYIAKDRFGNYDLVHYGVQGMKWGERKADELVGIGNSASNLKTKVENQTRSSSPSPSGSGGGGSKQIWANGRNGKTSSGTDSKAKVDPKLIQEAVKAESETPKDETEAKIEESNTTYQTALMQMQLLARISLANGISPSANPEYIEALRQTIKAKYELDQLKLKQQEEAAKNPPTMAEQKQEADSNAKKQLAEDKAKESSFKKSVESLEKTTDAERTGERAADVRKGTNRDKPAKKK